MFNLIDNMVAQPTDCAKSLSTYLNLNLKRQWTMRNNRYNKYNTPAGYSQHSVIMKQSIKKPTNKQILQWGGLWIPNNYRM